MSLPTPTDIPDLNVESPVTAKRRRARMPKLISNKIFDEQRCWNRSQRDLSADESPLYNETKAWAEIASPETDADEFDALPDFEGTYIA